MFEVNSYANKNGIWTNDFNEKEYFLFDSEDSSPHITNLISQDKRIYGFVKITYNDTNITGYNEYGSLDNLWSVYYGLVLDFLNKGESSAQFPDYELDVQILPLTPSNIVFRIGNIKEYTLPKVDFLQAIINGALSFYTMLSQSTNDSELEPILKILQTKLNHIRML
jgi:hypothetical protein